MYYMFTYICNELKNEKNHNVTTRILSKLVDTKLTLIDTKKLQTDINFSKTNQKLSQVLDRIKILDQLVTIFYTHLFFLLEISRFMGKYKLIQNKYAEREIACEVHNRNHSQIMQLEY